MYKIVLNSPLTINNCLPCPMSWGLCTQAEYNLFNNTTDFAPEAPRSIDSGEGTEVNCMFEDQPIIIMIKPQSTCTHIK